jgi:CheY-like chemotaxis protein
MTVLVVDDDLDQLAVRAELFRSSGFTAIEAAGREQALQLAADHRPGCVVMDLNLPAKADGLALIRELKELDPNVHVILLTGSDRKVLDHRVEATMVDAVLRKPAQSSKLIRALKAYG